MERYAKQVKETEAPSNKIRAEAMSEDNPFTSIHISSSVIHKPSPAKDLNKSVDRLVLPKTINSITLSSDDQQEKIRLYFEK